MNIVEERVTVHVVRAVGFALTQTEYDGERSVRVRRALEQEFILYPAVVFGHARSVDVHNFDGVERRAAEGVGDTDERALVDRVLRVALRSGRFEVARFHPDGELRARTRRHGDGGGGSEFLRRTEFGVVGARIFVVDHKDLGIVLIRRIILVAFRPVRAGVCDRGIVPVRVFVEGQVVLFDIERFVEVEVLYIAVVVILVIFPRLVVFQLVPSGHGFPFCRRLFFGKLRGFEIAEVGLGKIVPRRGVYDTARGFGRYLTHRRTRPTADGSTDEVRTVVRAERFKARVLDKTVVRGFFLFRFLGRGGAVGIVVVRAGGERRARGGKHHHR